MKEFLKYTLATIVGIIITSILFFFILLASVSAIIATGNRQVNIEKNSVLVLKSGMEIHDRSSQNPFASFDPLNMTFSQSVGLNEILKNLKKAADDANIKGILIESGLENSGWATAEEIRNGLNEFRKSGKFVIAYSDLVMTQQGYYLSSAADKIYIHPGSMIDFKGLSAEVIFLKKALDKLGVDVQVFRHGKFKGAVEPFLRNDLSDENRAQIKDFTGSIWNYVLQEISKSRNIEVQQLNTIADNLDGVLATKALDSKLIDGILYRDELTDTLKRRCGIKENKELNLVSMVKYSRVPEENKKYNLKSKISVIFAEGDIVTGKGNDNNIGGNRYADVIRKERKDSTVKAIVLRVNSPGGSANASDMIWREIELAAKAKPVIISMGNYAASGGYFISAPGSKIYADPVTISGSIGVFGLIPDAGSFLEKKLGITTDVVKTNANSDFPSITHPMNKAEQQVMQLSIEQTYKDFVSKVATGRKMRNGAVDSIGQGRVWSGSSAKGIGLIDEMGGLEDAIKGAASLAGVKDYSVRELPYIEDPYTKLLSQLGGELRMRILAGELGESFKYYRRLEEIKDLSGIQARLPFLIDIN